MTRSLLNLAVPPLLAAFGVAGVCLAHRMIDRLTLAFPASTAVPVLLAVSLGTIVTLRYAIERPRASMRRERQWREHGLCPACGYNLTGNTSGVCPECGAQA